MTSRRALTLVAIAVWVAVALTASPRALSLHHPAQHVRSADIPPVNCADFHARFDDRETIVQSEERTISKSEAPTLRVHAETNGSLYVQGGDQDVYSVTLCKAVEAGSDAEAILAGTHLSLEHGDLRITSPGSSGRWSAHLVIRAPKAAALELQVHNGPMTLDHVDGRVTARAENGPITVTNCTGELSLSSRNGPVTLEDNSGKQSVDSENGPLTVSLSGDSWNGSGIDARTTNGPVTLKVPSGYRSGVLLESEGNSPLQCWASVCAEGRKTSEGDHKQVAFGSGPTVVRLSTVNGPVSVR